MVVTSSLERSQGSRTFEPERIHFSGLKNMKRGLINFLPVRLQVVDIRENLGADDCNEFEKKTS